MNPSPFDSATLDILRTDLRDGRSFVVTFHGPNGLCALEFLGPRGMMPDGNFLRSPVRTLRLWVTGRFYVHETSIEPDAVLEDELHEIEALARSSVAEDEFPTLTALLKVIRSAVKGRKPRVPQVTLRVTEKGVPSFRGWASCLTLGDLERALRSALRPLESTSDAQAA